MIRERIEIPGYCQDGRGAAKEFGEMGREGSRERCSPDGASGTRTHLSVRMPEIEPRPIDTPKRFKAQTSITLRQLADVAESLGGHSGFMGPPTAISQTSRIPTLPFARRPSRTRSARACAVVTVIRPRLHGQRAVSAVRGEIPEWVATALFLPVQIVSIP